MDLRAEILKEHSKKQTVRLTKWIIKDQKRFDDLLNLFLHDEDRVVQRAAWIMKYVADDRPQWVLPHLEEMLEYCKQPVHDAVRRNVIRLLENIQIPKELQGLVATVCFDFLSSSTEPVAVKAFSMTVLANIAKEEPGIKQELVMLIEERMDIEKPAFRIRGKKILEQLKG